MPLHSENGCQSDQPRSSTEEHTASNAGLTNVRAIVTMHDELGGLAGVAASDVRCDARVVAGVGLLNLGDEQRVLIGENQSTVAVNLDRLIVFQPGDLRRVRLT